MAISDVRLGSIDLNLLVVFDAVMRERNVTRAAGGLGLSQSAISHALTRLRHMLKDDLFVRSPGGMMPTPRAERLALPVREALDNLQRSLEPPHFDPAATPRTFKIAADNYGALVLAGPIATHIAKIAPNVMLEIYPSGTRDFISEMDRGELELTIGSIPGHAERFSSQRLMTDDFIAVLREGHPMGHSPTLSIEAIAAVPHLAFTSIYYNTDFIDEALAEAKLTRRIALRAPMLTFVRILLDSDLLAILPTRIARNITQHRPLALHRLPCKSPPIETAMIWPRWLDDHQAHRWLREQIVAVSDTFTKQT